MCIDDTLSIASIRLANDKCTHCIQISINFNLMELNENYMICTFYMVVALSLFLLHCPMQFLFVHFNMKCYVKCAYSMIRMKLTQCVFYNPVVCRVLYLAARTHTSASFPRHLYRLVYVSVHLSINVRFSRSLHDLLYPDIRL